MTEHHSEHNRIRQRRTALGMTQTQLSERAGISRTAVTAIEGERLVPSVAAALALAQALGSTVEELFGATHSPAPVETWAWEPNEAGSRCWRADVGGRRVCYPAGATPMFTPLPDATSSDPPSCPEETLVIACCDPAAGLLATQFMAATGLRLLVIPRSSRQATEMLRDGLVHMAGVHLSTQDNPDRNQQVAREVIGQDYPLLRVARWQEGIATASSNRLRSVRAAKRARLTWVGRESGSGARQCLDRLLNIQPSPRRMASSHRGVTEAVRSGWADAGICVQLASAEAGLSFLPVQEEFYDICFCKSFANDRRCKALLSVVRSSVYRKLLAALPGYDSSETGDLVATT